MGVIWTTLTVLITVWLLAVAIAAMVRGPQQRAFRFGRDGPAAVLPIIGLTAYLLIVEVQLSLVAAVVAFAVGGGLGYLATWSNGAMPAIGLPFVWTSPWAMVLLGLSGAVTSIGGLGSWDALVEIGLAILCAAVGFGAGAFGFGVVATQDARRALDMELSPRVCSECETTVPAGATHCSECQEALPTYCASCGLTLAPGDVSCELCGSPTKTPLAEPSAEAITARFCHACLIPVSMGDVFCCSCGALLAPACPVCGAPATFDDEICSNCDLDRDSAAIAVESGLLATIVNEV